MVVGFLLIGIIAGLIAAGFSLLIGAAFGWAFVVYMVVGNIAMMLAGIACILRKESPARRSGVAGSRYVGNNT